MKSGSRARTIVSIAALVAAGCGGPRTGSPAAPALETPAAPAPGTTYTGRNGYVEYITGDLPLIITVPHGGSLTPPEIADRKTGIDARDLYTDDLAAQIVDVFVERTGRRPHLIINHLHRRKLDANRDSTEATDGDSLSAQAWREFHGFIDNARALVAKKHGSGLLLDIHGHSHTLRRLELGYLLEPNTLARPDSSIGNDVIDGSSVRALARRRGLRPADVLRGAGSLGAFIQKNGYDAVPSPAIPHPGNAPYFAGGYITERHGSRSGGRIDAIQIESHYTGVRDTHANRRRFAEALVTAVQAYLHEHYGSTG